MSKHTGRRICTKGDIEVIDCDRCGFAHITPYPAQEDLKKMYKDEFFEERPTYIQRFEEDLEWWNLLYNDRLEKLEALLGESKRVLDIGCGLGLFLKQAQNKGWEGLGIEPGMQASEYARSLGVDVRTGFFGEVDISAEPFFDAIHIAEVLEHVPEPVALLKKCRDLLSDGGAICAIVPNDFNKLQMLLTDEGYPSYWINPKVHINYFNFDSFSKLFEKAGYKVEIRDAVYPLEFFLLMGDNYIGNDELGRKCHFKRKDFDLKLANSDMAGFRKRFYSFLAEEGLGREIVLYARKK